jgi:hypothetical protein
MKTIKNAIYFIGNNYKTIIAGIALWMGIAAMFWIARITTP